ncbi:ap-2 complex subunit mu-1 [Colletotrichum higginsianum]|nr:ap-2 complex subunit mu-1 [Colletotrichum higginsianum]
MLSGILIFNQKGENLIFRAFRNDCRPRLADVFRIQVISNSQVRSPILTLGSTTFSHVKHENIYLVAITKSNANAALVFEFLYRLIALGRGYFGKFDEEAVKNNFVLTDTLKMYITTEGVKSERAAEDSAKITMQATGALSWRKADVRYRKNEAFVDVIEDVNLLMSATGAVLRADVTGQIVMRAYLSGTPECKFGLNDRLLLDNDGLLSLPSGNRMGTKATKAAAGSVTLEDCQFHQCVKLGKFDSDRIISFVPPDGEFELMRYRATENVNLPFKVHAIVNEVGRTKVEYSIGIKANFGSKLFATNVVVRIPTPLNTAKITERCTQGKAKYEPSENNIVWKIGRFTGQSEFVLSAEAILTSMTNQRAWSRPPLSLNFSLLMFTSSGLLVRYLKVFEKSNYSSVKWVRYMTRAGSYEIRHPYHPPLFHLRKLESPSGSGQPSETHVPDFSGIPFRGAATQTAVHQHGCIHPFDHLVFNQQHPHPLEILLVCIRLLASYRLVHGPRKRVVRVSVRPPETLKVEHLAIRLPHALYHIRRPGHNSTIVVFFVCTLTVKLPIENSAGLKLVGRGAVSFTPRAASVAVVDQVQHSKALVQTASQIGRLFRENRADCRRHPRLRHVQGNAPRVTQRLCHLSAPGALEHLGEAVHPGCLKLAKDHPVAEIRNRPAIPEPQEKHVLVVVVLHLLVPAWKTVLVPLSLILLSTAADASEHTNRMVWRIL